MKKAFTLLEVVFVLIILGILASIGSEILAKVYENYILSLSASKASYKLDIALLQIAQRLSHRVPNTVVVRDGADNLYTLQQPSSQIFTQIEWIGSAYEAKRGEWNGSYYHPGWSGLADLKASTKSKLVTPGSNLAYVKDILSLVYNVDLDQQDNNCSLIFRTQFEQSPIQAYGWDGSTPNAVYRIYRENNNTFAFVNTAPKTITDIYDLACWAYSIKYTNDNKLVLYYGYRPWIGENYKTYDHNVTLLENVTTFQIRSKPISVNNQFVQGSIEIRICTEENTTGTPIEFCGQKVIF